MSVSIVNNGIKMLNQNKQYNAHKSSRNNMLVGVRQWSLTMVVLMSAVFCVPVVAQSTEKVDIEALKAQLEEAQRLLEADKASHDETAEKKRKIDERLALRKQKEEEIFEELKQLCEDQEKINPGSLDDCMAKLNN